jgi:hypothetical protein
LLINRAIKKAGFSHETPLDWEDLARLQLMATAIPDEGPEPIAVKTEQFNEGEANTLNLPDSTYCFEETVENQDEQVAVE